VSDVLASDALARAAGRVRESVALQAQLAEEGHVEQLVGAAGLIAEALRGSRKLLLFGNGGSAADAQHIAAEFVGRFLRERSPLPALALTVNASAVTAIANDYGYEEVFARQVRAFGAAGDVAFGISTSGNSANVIRGLEAGREIGMHTIGLTGADGGRMHEVCDECLCFPSASTPRIQEGHILMAHVICEIVEDELAP
jgi:D-sedoheptulose 7-phosphate isomerase